jgi:hypothetical protein
LNDKERKALKSPLGDFEGFFNQLSSLNKKYNSSQHESHSIQQNNSILLSSLQSKEQGVEKALLNLGEMFTVCQNCGMRILKDELISGICFNCHNQEELHNEEKEVQHTKKDEQMIQLLSRIGELEAQVNSLHLAQQQISSKNNKTSFNQTKIPFQAFSSPQMQLKNVKPPPPPPPPQPVIADFVDITNLANITFSRLTMEELKSFTYEILSQLSLQQRNQYTSRLKELKLIEQMTPEEKATYLRNREQKNQHSVDQQSVIASLDDSSSPLFKKMREQAEKSSLVGKGTLGVLESKVIFVHCYNCNKSNKITENEEAICEFCDSPLNHR